MKNKLSCSVIRDLLPIYIDGLESRETNICVKEHLNNCDACRKEYNKIIENNKLKVNSDEIHVVKKFKKMIILMLFLIIIISGACVSLSMMCNKIQIGWSSLTIKDTICLIILNIGIYFIPMMALLICWIWKKISSKSCNYNISRVFFISFVIIVIALILNLIVKYIDLLYLF